MNIFKKNKTESKKNFDDKNEVRDITKSISRTFQVADYTPIQFFTSITRKDITETGHALEEIKKQMNDEILWDLKAQEKVFFATLYKDLEDKTRKGELTPNEKLLRARVLKFMDLPF